MLAFLTGTNTLQNIRKEGFTVGGGFRGFQSDMGTGYGCGIWSSLAGQGVRE